MGSFQKFMLPCLSGSVSVFDKQSLFTADSAGRTVKKDVNSNDKYTIARFGLSAVFAFAGGLRYTVLTAHCTGV